MATIEDSRQGVRSHSRMADVIVKGAIALVTAAFFIGAYLQFQVGFWLAVIAALSVYISLLMLHALTRRTERVQALTSEVQRLEGELARTKGGDPAARGYGKPLPRAAQAPGPAAPPPAAPSPRADLRADLRAEPRPSMRAPMPAPERGQQMPPPAMRAEPSFGPAGQPAAQPPAAPAQAPAPAARTAPSLSTPAPKPAAPAAAHAEPTLSPWPDPSAPSDSVHDYWSFRPAKPEATEKQPPALQPRFEPRSNEAAPKLPEASNDDDLEAVQGMIKRLAEEVNVGSAGDGAQAVQETATRVSVDALNTTAGTMRAATSKAPAGKRGQAGPAKGAGPSAPPPIAPMHSQLSSVGAALAVQRVSALLEPIIGLSDQQVHHYELSVVPVDDKGNTLPVDLRALAGTGILPLLDSARLARAAQVAGSFAAEGKGHQVFMAVSAEALANDRYLDDLANVYRQYPDLAGQMVLTFKQADVAQFGGAEWSALTDMRDLGFQFALVGVIDLDSEFTALRAAGFTFVKIEAANLISGLSAAGHTMPGGEVAKYLEELGLTVVVDHIDNEPARARVVECGVKLGQGPLFGAPITVPSDHGFGTAAA